jgi:ClpP class serine protease
MGETHAEIRRLQRVYQKDAVAYLNQMACSAAYHVASACSEIWLPSEGVAGSVGVILCTIDETEALEKAGMRVRYVVTGKRKADLHPGAPVTDDVLAVAQAKVDLLGQMFFEAVAESRDISPAKVEGYQAGVFVGQQVIDADLADGIAPWARFLDLTRASIRSGDNAIALPPKNPAAQALAALGAAKGGHATAKKYTPEQRSRRAKKAAKARWQAPNARARVH